jgi:ATP-dependent Clp protease, protease subunit
LQVDPRRRDPDKPSEAPPVRMPVVEVGGSQMDVISRLLKDRILLLGQQVNDEVANVLVAQVSIMKQTINHSFSLNVMPIIV